MKKLAAIALAAVLTSGLWAAAQPYHIGETELQVSNPYRFTMFIQVKCQWNQQWMDFDFQRVYELKGRQITNIKVPREYKSCQVWPTILWK